MIEQGKRPGRGCLFFTGIAVAISVSVLILASYIGYRVGHTQSFQFSAPQPMPVPEAKLSVDELAQLKERIANFSASVEQGKAIAPLSITATEANALIATHTNLVAVRGKMFFDIDGTNVTAQFSIPAEDLGFKPLQGRYINATGNFTVGFSNGVLNVNARSLNVKGKPIPDTFLGRILPQNFAYRLNNDPQGKAVLSKLQDVEVKDGRIVIVPKTLAP